MQGTRERILEIVVEHRDVRVEELSSQLEITQAAVRRHLDNLRADGLVEARSVRQATGRPYHSYHPTELALEHARPAYSDFLGRMLAGVGDNSELAGTISNSVAEVLASRHRGEFTCDESDPQRRVVELTQILRPEGILESWKAESDGIHLLNTTCPYRRAAEASSLPCESDRRAIELLLGLDVEQLHRLVDGSPVCEYVVRNREPQAAQSLEGAS